jgi:predicted DsbA family dithiol-disulfide isomerase
MGKRFPIKLPPWHEKRLIWWAAMKGTTKTMLAQNTLQARIEANANDIEVMLAERAGELGVTVETLKQQLLEKSSFSPDTDDEGSDRP